RRNRSIRIVVLGALGTGLAVLRGAPTARPAPSPNAVLRIGHVKQLFLDDFVVGSVDGLSRKLHEPTRHPRNPLIVGDQPWERWVIGVNGRPVMYDDESHEFKMWYGSYLPEAASPTGIRYRVCYAVSKDGIHWDRPVLGQVEWPGTRGTNIIKGGNNW